MCTCTGGAHAYILRPNRPTVPHIRLIFVFESHASCKCWWTSDTSVTTTIFDKAQFVFGRITYPDDWLMYQSNCSHRTRHCSKYIHKIQFVLWSLPLDKPFARKHLHFCSEFRLTFSVLSYCLRHGSYFSHILIYFCSFNCRLFNAPSLCCAVISSANNRFAFIAFVLLQSV